ncbi:MAG: moaD1 [Phycisphaerales bacterium]|nr:moaD1 [Phycisphaerales bacterium]
MNVTVKLFAVLRDKAGVAEMRLEISEGATVFDAVESILQRHPELTPFAKRVAFAVNLSRVDGRTVLNEGDELALLPPVSGG